MSRFPRWWFWAAVLVPAVLTVAGLTLQAGGIERRVEAEARHAVPEGTLVVDGRDVTVSGIPAERTKASKDRVQGAAGVRDVSFVEPVLVPMRFTFRAGEVVVTGVTGQQSWRSQFVGRLSKQTHGRKFVDETRTERGTDFPIETKGAETLVALFSQLPEDITVDVDGPKMTVRGVIPDDNRRKAVIAVMKRLFGDSSVIDQTKPKE
jgi:hypothetical protein